MKEEKKKNTIKLICRIAKRMEIYPITQYEKKVGAIIVKDKMIVSDRTMEHHLV